MAIQSFTSGQTLTANQMSTLQANDYNWSTNAQTASYVLVASDVGKVVTMTNAGATTITVNTSLFAAGDRVKIINLGAGACTITAGTATVNSASSLALTQYQAGTLWFSSASAAIFIPDDKTVSSGLQYITGTSFSAVSSFSLPNNTFTSTYRNYRLYMEITSVSADMTVTARMRQSGADNSSSNYYFEQMGWSVAALTQTNQATATTSWTMGNMFTATYSYGQIIIDITSPQLAQRTLATGTTIIAANNTHWGQSIAGMIFSSTNQFDAMSFICNTGNFTGVYRVYGYSES